MLLQYCQTKWKVARMDTCNELHLLSNEGNLGRVTRGGKVELESDCDQSRIGHTMAGLPTLPDFLGISCISIFSLKRPHFSCKKL